MKKTIVTTGCFDNLSSKQIRFLYEIARLGNVTVLLMDDDLTRSRQNGQLKFPLPERKYYLESVRYVSRVVVISDINQFKDIQQVVGRKPDIWAVSSLEENADFAPIAQAQQIPFQRISEEFLKGFPTEDIGYQTPVDPSRKKVIVTGSFDWFHSGHVRFLEEASEYGNLYAIAGHDQNILELKGPGHPLFKQDERLFMIGAIRFVTQALISTGHGWMDAEPEIHRLKPDVYIVNEDGDKEPKRQFCQTHGLEYLVLKRTPKEGLQRRTSTNLRGF